MVFFVLAPWAVRAQTPAVEVTPLVIDDASPVRGILDYDIKIKNNSEPYKATFYPTINDIAMSDGKQEILDFSPDAERSKYLSRWTEFSRGVIDLMPGEEKNLHLKIDIDPLAAPGIYHAELTFAEGPNRSDAEKNAQTSVQPKVIINIAVKDNIVEKAELTTFKAANQIFFSTPAKLFLSIKNTGNSEIAPTGSIFIYNRSGQELSQLDVNKEGWNIQSLGNKDLSFDWSEPKAFGMYKAKLEMNYGSQAGQRDLQDTVYFWVLPWPIVGIFGAVLLSLFVLIVLMNYKRKKSYSPQAIATDEIIVEGDEDAAGVINLRRR